MSYYPPYQPTNSAASSYGYGAAAGAPASTAPPSAAAGPPSAYRPTFSDDGKGVPFNSFLNMMGSASVNYDVSYDTNSKDPVHMRSRVFIGNLIVNSVSREDVIDVCRDYGTIVAATMFKGFSFVQFSRADEADACVAGLNGKRWKGSLIEVRLAVNPKFGSAPPPSKKKRVDDVYFDETMAANDRNRRLVMSDNTNNEDLADTSMADTLICGGCRFVTCDFEVWKQHRIAGCAKPKDLKEPKILSCASCSQSFPSSWGLIVHLTDFHRMMLFRPDTGAPKEKEPEPAAVPVSAPAPVQAPPQVSAPPVHAPSQDSSYGYQTQAASNGADGNGEQTAAPEQEVHPGPTFSEE